MKINLTAFYKKSVENGKRINEKKFSDINLQSKKISDKDFDKTDLGEIKGVGEETIRILFENGIRDKKTLIEKGIGGIKISIFAKKGIEKFLNNKKK